MGIEPTRRVQQSCAQSAVQCSAGWMFRAAALRAGRCDRPEAASGVRRMGDGEPDEV